MRNLGSTAVGSVLLFLVAGPGAAGCGLDGLGGVREVTYAPDIHYITQREIRTTMGELAVEVVALEEIMQKEGGPEAADREAVVAILSRMKKLSSGLKKRSESNHPRIDRDAPRLQADIERALDAVRLLSPPNYYYAGRIVGSCTYCHVAPVD